MFPSNRFQTGRNDLLSQGDGKCDFISYYPFQETGINQDQSIMQVQIHTDQSSVSKHSLSDFMIATNSDITPVKIWYLWNININSAN